MGGWLAGSLPVKSGGDFGNLSWAFVIFSAMLPCFLVFGKKAETVVLVWLLVSLLGLSSGFMETLSRTKRKCATAPDTMKPAVALAYDAIVLVRSTGWATQSSHGSWRYPAVLISAQFPENTDRPTHFAHRGDGILVSGKKKPPLPGEIRALVLRITVPKGGDLPGMFNYRQFLAGRNIQWQGKVLDETRSPRHGPIWWIYNRFLSPARTTILNTITKLFPPLEASLASAVLLGAKNSTSKSASSPFADMGLAHLFAVSGLHVGVLLGLFLLPGKILGISPWHKWFSLMFLLPIYALLTGLPGSVVRASGLAILAIFSHPVGRNGSSLHFLGVLFWATTIWNPDQVLDTGVRLSYSAAAGILAFTTLTKELDYPRSGWRGFILGGLFISLAAQWFTLPLAASSFGRISLISPLANLVAVPTFGLGVWLVVLSLVFSILPWNMAEMFSSWAWLIFRSLEVLVKTFQVKTGGVNLGLPVPSPLMVLIWIILTALSLVYLYQVASGKFKVKWMAIFLPCTGLLMLGLFHNPWPGKLSNQGPEVWQFDVGQGDCSFIRFPDGWTALIDTGGRYGFSGSNSQGPLSRAISPWLERYGIINFDAVILTHGHLDHTGGAAFLKSNSQVKQWFGAGEAFHALQPDTSGLKMTMAVHGQILHQWESWSLQVFFPLEDTPDDFHENDYSIVTALRRHGKTQLLWSGDLEKAGEKCLLQGPGLDGRTRVWKAGHHGSNTSGSQPFLEIIKPELILISCGVGNQYKHPSHDHYVVSGDSLDVVRTDLEGSIHLKFHNNGEISWESQIRQEHLSAAP